MGQREDLDTVVLQDYAGLRGLAWNRDPSKPIAAAEAYALYERNWRFIDDRTLADDERRLVAALTDRFGHGAFLGRR